MPNTNPAPAVPAAAQPALYDEVSKLVAQSGGVGGLVQTFESQGLGGVIRGWVSNGANPAISGEDVMGVIGRDKIMQIASKAGLSEQQVAAGISQILPQVVDHLTPNGTVPNHAPDELGSAMGFLKSKLFG